MPKDKATGKKLADMMYGDLNRPAFGVYPMIAKRREDRQDREAAKNFPIDLGRGVFAGGAGLAGDMESLGRLPYVLYTGNESPTFLPTSEEILKRLPYGSDSPVGQLASGLGTLAGGSVPFGVIPKVVKAGAKGAMAAGRAGERMAEKYVPQIMERGGAGADILSGMAQGTRSQIFIGPNAKTFNKAKADAAINMEQAGVDPVDIWRQTGTFRGADGIMRQEISDAGAVYRNPEQLKELGKEKKEQALELRRRLVTPIDQKDMFPKALTEAKKPVREEAKRLKEEADVLGRYSDVRGQPAKFVYEHPELYKAYPELGDVQVYQGGRGTMGEKASMRGSGPDIEMEITQKGLKADPRSSILHEMQHGVQNLERMAPGGNTVTAFQNPEALKILGDMRLKANTPMSFEDFLKKGEYQDDADTLARAAEEYKDYVEDVPMLAKRYDRDTQETAAGEYYKRLAGEAEARAAQAREPMGAAERGQEFPYSSYDVLPEDLIVKPAKDYAGGGRVHFSDNPDTMALELAGGGKVGFISEGIKAAAKALKPAKEAAVPLQVPRARPTTKDILEAAERVGKQQAGEFVTNPLSGKTTNLAGRSKKEVERLKNMEYKVTPIKDLPEMKPYEAKVGEVNIAVPGDQTISDMLLESVDGMPIGTTSEGGALFGRGRLSDPEDTRAFWASNIGPAELFQKKVTELARLYDTDMVTAYHLAMGSMSNNFAQHLADASMRATDYSKLSAPKMKAFDRVMREGYIDPVSKERVAFPNWPGIAFPEESLQVLKEDPLLRKWYSNRMKTPKVTEALDLPNAKSIEYAMTEPDIRNMEINLTGLSAGRMKPGAELRPDSSHNTYSHDILGTAVGRAPELAPFSISFPDVTSFVREKYRPQDFTGTIQKVFPHQVVDEAYLEDMQKYYEQLRKVRGYKEGGAVKSPAAKIDGNDFVLAAKKYGLDDSMRTLNKIVSLVNQGATVDEAARIVSNSTVRISDNPDVMALELAGGGKVGAITSAIKGLFSAVDKTAQNLKRPAGTGKEFMAEVKATPGVKATELKGRKLAEIEAMPKMTKAQFIKELEARPPVKIEEKVLGQPSQKDIDALADKLAYEKGRSEAYEFSDRGDDIDAMTEENYRLSLKFDWEDHQAKAREMLSEGDSGPFHEKYAIPGGENYREILLKMPQQLEKGYRTPNGAFFTEQDLADPIIRQAAETVGLTPATRAVGKGFSGNPAHFGGEPNILASIRVSDRMVPTYTPEQAESIGQRIAQGINVANPKNLASGAPEMAVKRGIVTPLEAAQYSDYRGYKSNDLTGAREKVLHVEEIQSDWHQAGRKARTDEIKRLVDSGMSKQEAQAAVPEDYGYSTNMAARRKDLHDRYMNRELSLDQYDYLDRELTSVPDAPFKKDWQELALRKVMELASEGGYDRVALTPGAEQASRYDLSKQISRLEWKSRGDEPGKLIAYDKNGVGVIEKEMSPDELAENVGKDVADRLLSSDVARQTERGHDIRQLSGLDIKSGGEGMESFYDKMLPDYLNKLGKQYGVQVGEMDLPYSPNDQGLRQLGGYPSAPMNTLHSLEVTPQMREDINTKGQPLYSKIGVPGAEAAGAATIGSQIFDENNEQQVQNPIQFTENPDAMRLELMQRN